MKPVISLVSWEGNGVDGFKNSHRGGLWGRGRELRFNISQVTATDIHHRTQSFLILIKNSRVWASAHSNASPLWIWNWMGNEPSSMQLWNMYSLPHTPSFSFGMLSYSVCICAAISICLSFSPCLFLSLTPLCPLHFLPVGIKQWESHHYKWPTNLPQVATGLSSLVVTLLFSHSSPLYHTVNWIESFKFPRFR